MLQFTLGGEPPCMQQFKACVQVTGHGHQGQPQKLFFYEQAIHQPKIVDSEEVNAQIQASSPYREPTDCPSTLFYWQLNDIAGLKLGLQIDKADGGKLFLPLADTLNGNADYDAENDHKYNQLIAFIPFAVYDLPRKIHYFTVPIEQVEPDSERLRLANRNLSSTLYAPARPGFLYIFYQDKLWREIYIKQDASGKNVYQDIDVFAARIGGQFKADIGCEYKSGQPAKFSDNPTPVRPAVGASLQDIWIPHKIAGKKVAVRLLFSEDQLSGERLNLIEQSLLASLTSVDVSGTTFAYAQDAGKASNLYDVTPAFRLDYLPPTRGRNEKIEWRLSHPHTYMLDSKGRSLKKKYDATKRTDRHCLAKTAPDSNLIRADFHGQRGAFKEFEIDAWHHILEQQYSEDTSANEIWGDTIADSATNVIAPYQPRYILGIAVPDPLNALHHMQTLLDIAQSSKLFSFLAIRASNDPHHAVGHFAHNMAFLFPQVKETIEHELDTATTHRFNLAISGAERAYLRHLIGQCQDNIVALLQQPATVQAIINLLSNHIPHLYAANLNFIAHCLSVIGKAPLAYDSLAATISADITAGQVFIQELATDRNHPLHRALWPTVSFDDMKQPLVEPTPTAGDNRGDGAWYAPALIANREWQGEVGPSANLKLLALAIQAQSQLEGNLLTVKDTLKLGWSAIYNITSLLLDAIDSADHALEQLAVKRQNYRLADGALKTAAEIAEQSGQAVENQRGILDEETAKGQQTTQQDHRTSRRLSEAEKRLAALEARAQATLAKRAGLFQNKAFLPAVYQSRLSLPQLKTLGYILPRTAGAKYIAFGDYSQGNLDELENILQAYPSKRVRQPGRLAEKLLHLLEKAGDAADAVRNGLNFMDDVFVLGIANAVENHRFIAAYADGIDEAFDAMLAKMDASVKRAEAIERVAAQRNNLARALWQNRRDIHALTAAQAMAEEAEAMLLAANNKFSSLNQQQSQFALKHETFLRGKTIPAIVFFVELCNIASVLLTAKSTAQDRGIIRTGAGLTSAAVDGGFAYALLAERFNSNRAKILHEFLDKKVSFKLLDIIGIGEVPMRGLIGAGVMALTALVSFWDAVHYYNDRNPAWIGHAVSGAGASVMVMQALTSAALSGPVGWVVLGVGLGLMLAGMYLVPTLDNSNSIKAWFKHGVFGGAITDAKYRHLADPQQAIYRLLSELIQINVTVTPVADDAAPTVADNLIGSLTAGSSGSRLRSAAQQLLLQQNNGSYRVAVTGYFAGLLQSCLFIPYLAKYRIVSTYSDSGSMAIKVTKVNEVTINELGNRVSFNARGMAFYLSLPNRVVEGNGDDVTTISYKWLMQLQLHAYPTTPALDKRFWVFPAPRLDDGSEFTPETASQHSRPAFPERDWNWYSSEVAIHYQPFWWHKVLLTSQR